MKGKLEVMVAPDQGGAGQPPVRPPRMPPREPEPRFALLRIMLGNAFLLSTLYLVLGVAVDALRLWAPAEWVDRLSLVVDSLPGRALVLTGLMPTLRELWREDHLTTWQLRLIFAATTVVIIFALALVVGAWMWLLRKAWEWRESRTRRA